MLADYYIKKKHIFKKRQHKFFNYSYKLMFGNIGFYSLKHQRFDLVYIRFIKKLCRRRYCKVKMRFFKPKFYIKLSLNYICSMKSKNARMGAGVGKFVRLVTQIYINYIFIEFKLYSIWILKKLKNFLNFKCNLLFEICSKNNN